ncbi:hypothetical protein [Cylindrospermum sp. FACHB-282]|uniref:hypothetical protein n=1 Tax=Cylindrospermum sp. FACHB-282 TaxID=2692794 RepID=UPI0016820162|nr:hypothetical protein [Cylindrospermum sp. FACHB-282]MBD2385524.1 hypothetical protein [Cylindrospermum sp. FACHB-282]
MKIATAGNNPQSHKAMRCYGVAVILEAVAMLGAIGTPALPPKPRGKSPGWTPGKLRLRKTRFSIVKKTATPPRQKPSVAV